MRTIERVVRVMTHVNIGATLGMGAWILWSGWQVATGHWTVPRIDPPAAPAQASPDPAQPVDRPCCLAPGDTRQHHEHERHQLQVRATGDTLVAAARHGDVE